MPRVTAFAVAMILAWLVVSCGHESPVQPSTTLPPTTTPPGETIRGLRIDGPNRLAPGTTAQYTAIAEMGDGTTRDVTSTAIWRSSDGGVLSLGSDGTATGGKAGQVVVAATALSRAASLEVLVLSPGTFRLTGFVREAGFPVFDANVAVLDGSRAVLSTTSDLSGRYRLFGIPAGNVEVRATRPGYGEQVNRLSVSSDVTSDFTLTQASPFNLTGNYQLAVTARPGCDALPPETRARTFGATITQDGPRVNVTITGPDVRSRTFTGRAEPDYTTLTIRGYYPDYYYYYRSPVIVPPLDVVEELTPTSVLTFAGIVTVPRQSSPAITGSLNGIIATLPSTFETSPRITAYCIGAHLFVLTRR